MFGHHSAGHVQCRPGIRYRFLMGVLIGFLSVRHALQPPAALPAVEAAVPPPGGVNRGNNRRRKAP